MVGYARTLTELGHEITSRWILGGHEAEEHTSIEQKRIIALENIDDIDRAKAVVCFTESAQAPPPGSARGGRHVEFGYVLGKVPSKSLYVVGPIENVFHTLTPAFPTWTEFVDYLHRITVRP